MRKIKILVISPYKGMHEIVKSLIEETANEQFIIYTEIGDLDEGVKIAKRDRYKDCDIIISRGGTANLLREHFSIPIIDVSISVYDVLRAITSAELYDTKFAIVGFSNITDCAKLLCDLLIKDIDILPVTTVEKAREVLTSLKEKGYDLVVCDMISSTIARSIGLNSILVLSGRESILSALNKAKQLASSIYKIHTEKEIFQRIARKENTSLYVYDKNKALWYSHKGFDDFEELIEKFIKQYLSTFMKAKDKTIEKVVKSKLFRLKGRTFTYESEPYTVIEVSIQDDNPLWGDSLSIYNYGLEKDKSFASDYNSASYIGLIRKQIEEYGNTNYPIIITGEMGTGKEKAAHTLYDNSHYKDSPLYKINCDSINTRQWNYLIDNESSPLYDIQTTLFFQNVGALKEAQFHKLLDFLPTLIKANRVLISITEDNTKEYEKNIEALKNSLPALILALPPLRERRNELPSIIALYINQLNTILGKQIIGLTPDAMSLMEDFPWPGNLEQLQRILRESMIVTNSSYINETSINSFIAAEQPNSCISFIKETSLDLSGTLDEINYQLIQQILAEEQGNKDRTAKRLGIGRSTLWRILKSHEA